MTTDIHLNRRENGCINCHQNTSPLNNPMQQLGCGHFIHENCLSRKIQAAKNTDQEPSFRRLLHLSPPDPMRCSACATPICRHKIHPSHQHHDLIRSAVGRYLRCEEHYIEAELMEGKVLSSTSASSGSLKLDLTSDFVRNQMNETTIFYAYRTLFERVLEPHTIQTISHTIRIIEFVRPSFSEIDDHSFNVAERTCFIELMRNVSKFTHIERISVNLTETSRFHFLESFHNLNHITKLPKSLKVITLRFLDPIPDYRDETKFHDFAWYIQTLATDIRKRAKKENSPIELKLINARTDLPIPMTAFQESDSSLNNTEHPVRLYNQLAIYAAILLTPATLGLSIMTYLAYKIAHWASCPEPAGLETCSSPR